MKNIAEIIEANTKSFLVESYFLDDTPEIGSFVMTEINQQKIFGVISEIFTTSQDPSRQISALGDPETNYEEILNTQPQIKKLLKTYFKAQIVAVDNQVTQPKRPPKVHGSVKVCEGMDLKFLFENYNYLKYLIELADAVIINHLEIICNNEEERLKAGKVLAYYLRDDYQRLCEIV